MGANDEITFTVVIPTFDRADLIGRAVQSVLRQTYEAWELAIVDDGSTDDTASALDGYLDDPRITLLSCPHRGPAASRNEGVEHGTGAFVAFLDSDDEVTPSWLHDFADRIDSADGDVGYVSCGYWRAGRPVPPVAGRGFVPEPYNSLAGTFAVRRDVFDSIGRYDRELRQSENWEMVVRALAECRRRELSIAAVPQCNMVFHRAKSQAEQRQRDLDRADTYLHLYDKYAHGGVLHDRRERFLLGAAVNFARAGELTDSRRWFYRNLRRYPSLKNLGRVACFEVPPVRKRLWMSGRNAAAAIES